MTWQEWITRSLRIPLGILEINRCLQVSCRRPMHLCKADGRVILIYAFVCVFIYSLRFNWMWNKSVGDQDERQGLNLAMFVGVRIVIQLIYVWSKVLCLRTLRLCPVLRDTAGDMSGDLLPARPHPKAGRKEGGMAPGPYFQGARHHGEFLFWC